MAGANIILVQRGRLEGKSLFLSKCYVTLKAIWLNRREWSGMASMNFDKGRRAMHLGQAIVVAAMSGAIALDLAYDPPEQVGLLMYVLTIGLAAVIGILTDVLLPYRKSLRQGRATAQDRPGQGGRPSSGPIDHDKDA